MRFAVWQIVIVLVLAVYPAGPGSTHDGIVFAGGARGALSYDYFRELATELRRLDPDLRVGLRVTGGSMDNLRRIKSGQIDIALISLEASEERDPPPGLSALWTIEGFPLVIAVRADIPMRSLKDLGRLRMIAGGAGAAMESFVPRLFDHIGIRPTWKRSAWEQIPYMLTSGQIDGIVVPEPTLKVISDTFGAPDMRIVGFPDDLRNDLVEDFPTFLSPVNLVLDSVTYPTAGIKAAIVIRNDIPDEVVSLLFEARQRMEDANAIPEYMRSTGPPSRNFIDYPYHPVALQREKGESAL